MERFPEFKAAQRRKSCDSPKPSVAGGLRVAYCVGDYDPHTDKGRDVELVLPDKLLRSTPPTRISAASAIKTATRCSSSWARGCDQL